MSRACQLSVVVPVHNEAEVLVDLVRRCCMAGEKVDPDFEVVIVDDASTDGTQGTVAGASWDPRVRFHRLGENAGQFGATKEGLRLARGAIVVVLDGDLQDPPELIPLLVHEWENSQSDVVFGVKKPRGHPAWFLVGQAIYRGLLATLSRVKIPPGLGSYCLMHRRFAEKVAQTRFRSANLGAVLAALNPRFSTVEYGKAVRYDGRSRVGIEGLIREAANSFVATGVAPRLFYLGAFVAAVFGALGLVFWEPWIAGLVILLGLCLVLAGRGQYRRFRENLEPVQEK